MQVGSEGIQPTDQHPQPQPKLAAVYQQRVGNVALCQHMRLAARWPAVHLVWVLVISPAACLQAGVRME
jgi:hypothetical protein